MAEEGGEKSHDPTPRRREQAREEGQVARSQDLAASLVLLAAIVLLMTLGKDVVKLFIRFTQFSLGEAFFLIPENMDADGLTNAFISHYYATTLQFLGPTSLFFGSLLIVAVGANLAQVGLLWLPNKLGFDFSRLDPIKGFGRIFSMQSVMRLLMGIVKIVICAIVAYYAVKNEIGTIINLTTLEEPQICTYLAQTLLWIALKVAVALAIISIIDYIYQKWKHEQDLRMTTEELRQEMKNMMGDPQIVSKRRQIQREMASKERSARGTPDADVVVTNPTHLAVAIKYDPDTMEAPVVVAKGADYLAQQIRQIALEHGIPILERKPLAWSLFEKVRIGQAIFDEHYKAVAEVLAWVHRFKRK